MDLKKYVDWRKFSVCNGFRVVGERRRAEKRRDGMEEDFIRFWRDGHEKK